MIPNVRIFDDRRSILVSAEDGSPVPVDVTVIPSDSTAGRVRVAFTIEIEGRYGKGVVLLSPPFRLEAN